MTDEFARLFPRSKPLRDFLAEYLIRVVQLCKKIVTFSQKSPNRLLGTSFFSSFDREFGSLRQELDQYGLLIEKQCLVLTTQLLQETQVVVRKRGMALEKLVGTKTARLLLHERQQSLLAKLSPEQAIFEAIGRRERKKGDCAWLLGTPTYAKWKAEQRATLHVTGHLGSGKTVALANIVADLHLEKRCCAYFFCKRESRITLNSHIILGSVAHQLIQQTFAKCHWELLDRPEYAIQTLTSESLQRLLPVFLPKRLVYWVVLDGLEECSREEIHDTLTVLHDLSQSLKMTFCFSARADSDTLAIFESLATQPGYTIFMNDPARDGEMEGYIKSEVQRRNLRRPRPLAPEIEALIAKQLTFGAQGMQVLFPCP